MTACAKHVPLAGSNLSETVSGGAGITERELSVRQKIARLTPKDRAMVRDCIERLLADMPPFAEAVQNRLKHDN